MLLTTTDAITVVDNSGNKYNKRTYKMSFGLLRRIVNVCHYWMARQFQIMPIQLHQNKKYEAEQNNHDLQNLHAVFTAFCFEN